MQLSKAKTKVGLVTEAMANEEIGPTTSEPHSEVRDLSLCLWCVFCTCFLCIGFDAFSTVSRVDTEPAQEQPAMTDWWWLSSCAGCSFVVNVFLSVCVCV